MSTVYLVERPLVTKARDNHDHEYDVTMKLKGVHESMGQVHEKFSYRWILDIKRTPASWYMNTLIDNGDGPLTLVRRTIDIDTGAGWVCVNIDEVITEALRMV